MELNVVLIDELPMSTAGAPTVVIVPPLTTSPFKPTAYRPLPPLVFKTILLNVIVLAALLTSETAGAPAVDKTLRFDTLMMASVPLTVKPAALGELIVV